MDVIKISVPRNNLTPARMDKIGEALRILGARTGDYVDVTQTDTRTTYTVRNRFGY